jgi:hypothetical protein
MDGLPMLASPCTRTSAHQLCDTQPGHCDGRQVQSPSDLARRPCVALLRSCNVVHKRHTCDAVCALATYCCSAGGKPSDIELSRGCRRTFSESRSSILACGQSPLYLSHLAQVLVEIQTGEVLACVELRRLDEKSSATLGSLVAMSLDLVLTMIYLR